MHLFTYLVMGHVSVDFLFSFFFKFSFINDRK